MCRSTGEGTITLLENNLENENFHLSPMACSFRKVLTSVGEQLKEQLQNLRIADTEPFSNPAVEGLGHICMPAILGLFGLFPFKCC